MKHRPVRRQGQALLETAFVLPLFLMLVFVFVQLGLWSYGRFQAAEAARVGVQELNSMLATVSAPMASDERLIANFNLLPASVRDQVVPACRRSINTNALNRGWNGNGCVPGLPSTTAPLSAAINSSRNYMQSTRADNLYGSVTYRACYLDINGNTISCGGGASSDAAPAFVMVEITATNPDLIFPNFNPGNFTVRQYAVAQRYMAACPIDSDPNCMRVNGYTR